MLADQPPAGQEGTDRGAAAGLGAGMAQTERGQTEPGRVGSGRVEAKRSGPGGRRRTRGAASPLGRHQGAPAARAAW